MTQSLIDNVQPDDGGLVERPEANERLSGDPPAASSPQGLADREKLALVAVERIRTPMVVTDPRQIDNPIVLANKAFLDLTGYSADEIVGFNCRFLQGSGTDPSSIATIRKAVAAEQEVEVEMLNYRKDGSAFWNRVFVSPVHDEDGRLVYFFASQQDETAQRRSHHLEAVERRLLKEVDHRAKNALALVYSIVRLSRRDTIENFASSVEGRVGAIARSHLMLAEANWAGVPIGQMIGSEAATLGGRNIMASGPDAIVPPAVVQPLGLLLHELFDNAARHGALSVDEGRLDVSWTSEDDGRKFTICLTETGGPVPLADRRPGLGSALIQRVLEDQLGGEGVFDWQAAGLRSVLSLPLAG